MSLPYAVSLAADGDKDTLQRHLANMSDEEMGQVYSVVADLWTAVFKEQKARSTARRREPMA